MLSLKFSFRHQHPSALFSALCVNKAKSLLTFIWHMLFLPSSTQRQDIRSQPSAVSFPSFCKASLERHAYWHTTTVYFPAKKTDSIITSFSNWKMNSSSDSLEDVADFWPGKLHVTKVVQHDYRRLEQTNKCPRITEGTKWLNDLLWARHWPDNILSRRASWADTAASMVDQDILFFSLSPPPT